MKPPLGLVIAADHSPGVLSPHTPEDGDDRRWRLPGALHPKQTPRPPFLEPKLMPAGATPSSKTAPSPKVPNLLHTPKGPLPAKSNTVSVRDMLQWQQKDLGQESRQLATWQRATGSVHAYHVTKSGMLQEQLAASKIHAQLLIDRHAALESQLSTLLKELDAPGPHVEHQELLAQNSQAQLAAMTPATKTRTSADKHRHQQAKSAQAHETTGGLPRAEASLVKQMEDEQLAQLFHSAEELDREHQQLADVLRVQQQLQSCSEELQAEHVALKQSLLEQLRTARVQEVTASVQLQAVRSAQMGVEAQLDSLKTMHMKTSSQSLNLLLWGDDGENTHERMQHVIAAAMAEMQRKGRRPHTQAQRTRPHSRQQIGKAVQGVDGTASGTAAGKLELAGPELDCRSSTPQARAKGGMPEAAGQGTGSTSLLTTPVSGTRQHRHSMQQSMEESLPDLSRQAPIRQLMSLVDLSSRLTGLGRLASSLQDVLNLASTLQHRTARQDGLHAVLTTLKSLASAQQVTIFGVRGNQFWSLAEDKHGGAPSTHPTSLSGQANDGTSNQPGSSKRPAPPASNTELQAKAPPLDPSAALPVGPDSQPVAEGQPTSGDSASNTAAATQADGQADSATVDGAADAGTTGEAAATPLPREQSVVPAAEGQSSLPDRHSPQMPKPEQPSLDVNAPTRISFGGGMNLKLAMSNKTQRFKSIVSSHFIHKHSEPAVAATVEVRPVKRGMVSYVVQSGSTIAVPSLRKCFAYDPAHGDPPVPPHCVMPALVMPIFKPQLTSLNNIPDLLGGRTTAGADTTPAGACCAVIQLLGKASSGPASPAAQNSGMPNMHPQPCFTSTQVHLVGVVGAALGQALTTWDKWSAQQTMLKRREGMLAHTRRLAAIQEPAALLTEIARIAALECHATAAVIYLADRARGELVGHMVTRMRITDYARDVLPDLTTSRMSTSGRPHTARSITSTSPERRRRSVRVSSKGTAAPSTVYNDSQFTFSQAVRFKRSSGGLLGQVIASGTCMVLNQEQASGSSLQDLPPGWGSAPAMAMMPIPSFSGASKHMGVIQVLGCLPSRGDIFSPNTLKYTASFTSQDVDMLAQLAHLTSCTCSYVVNLGNALEYHVSAGLVAAPPTAATGGLQPLLNAGSAATASTGAAELLLGLKNIAEGAKKLGSLIRDALQCESSRVFEVWGKSGEFTASSLSPSQPRYTQGTVESSSPRPTSRLALSGLRAVAEVDDDEDEDDIFAQNLADEKQLAVPVAPGEYHVYHIERGVAGLAAESGTPYTFNGASMLLREVRSARKLVDNLRASMRVEADIAYRASSEGRSPTMALREQSERMASMLAAAEKAAAAANNPLESSPGTFKRAASRASSRSNLMARGGFSPDGRDRSRRTTFMGPDDSFHEEAPTDAYDAAVDGGGSSPWGCLAVPIKMHGTGEVYAVLEGVNKRRGRFNNEDVRTLTRIGQQASVVFTIAKAAEGLDTCNKLVSDLSTCLASISAISSEVRIQRVQATGRASTEVPQLRRLGRCISELLPNLLPGCTYIGVALPRVLIETGGDASGPQPNDWSNNQPSSRQGSSSVYKNALPVYVLAPPCAAPDVEEQLLQCVSKTFESGHAQATQPGGTLVPCEVVGTLTQVDDITGRTRPLVLRYVLPFTHQDQSRGTPHVEGALVCQLNGFNANSTPETCQILSCLTPHIARVVDAIFADALRLGSSQGDRTTPPAPPSIATASVPSPSALRGKAQVSDAASQDLGAGAAAGAVGAGVEVEFRVVDESKPA